MAASTTFDDINLSAAHIAAAESKVRNPRSSWYVDDKGPSRFERGTAKFKMMGRSAVTGIKKIFGKGKKEPIEISAPLSFLDPGTFERLTGQRPTTSGTALSTERLTKGYSVRNGSNAPVVAPKPEPKGVSIAHPLVTAVLDSAWPASEYSSGTNSVGIHTSVLGSEEASTAPSSAAGTPRPAPFPVKSIFEETLANSINPDDTHSARKAFADKLDGHPKDPRPTSMLMVSSYNPQSTAPRPRVNSELPILPQCAFVNPHISGFDDPRATYQPGMFMQSSSRLSEVTSASRDEIQASLDALNGKTPPVTIAESAPTAEEQPLPKPRARPLTDTNLPNAPRDSLYFAYGSGIGEPFNPYYGSPYPSSEAVGAGRDSSVTFPSNASTAPSSPGIPFTRDPHRHSQFVEQVEKDLTFTPDLPGRPANPKPSATPGSAEYLESVYANPPAQAPAPPPQPRPQQDSLQVPVIPRKPVPSRAAEPSKSEPDLNKPLPSSPAPHSARRFTPATKQYPPRTDSLINPVASFSRLPVYQKPTATATANANANVPQRYSMNDNGYQIFDQRASAAYQAAPEYVARRPMNEMEAKERDQAVKREKSQKAAEAKAAAKARAKAEKKMRKEDEDVKKLICRHQ